MKILSKITLILAIFVLLLIPNVYAINSINLNLSANTSNTNSTNINTTTNASTNTSANTNVDSSKVTKVTNESGTLLTTDNIINIILIVVGIVLILLAIAILIRCK